MNLARITWKRDGVTHSELRTWPVARAYAAYLLRTYRIEAVIETA